MIAKIIVDQTQFEKWPTYLQALNLKKNLDPQICTTKHNSVSVCVFTPPKLQDVRA